MNEEKDETMVVKKCDEIWVGRVKNLNKGVVVYINIMITCAQPLKFGGIIAVM